MREPDLRELRATNEELRVQIEALRVKQAELAVLLEHIREEA